MNGRGRVGALTIQGERFKMSKAAKDIQFGLGGIISSFATLEAKIQEFIAAEYIDNADSQLRFYEEVLEQDFFSFELKKRIFRTALKSRYSDRYKSFPFKELNRMQIIRNIAAHGLIEANTPNDIFDINKLYFRHGGKQMQAVDLINEFSNLKKIVFKAIFALPGVITAAIVES